MFERAMTQQATNAARLAEERFAPDVVRVRFYLAEDHAGDPSVFWNILLSDEIAATTLAVRGDNQSAAYQLTKEVQRFLYTVGDSEEIGYHSYYNYRSVSEQARLKEKEWE